MDEPGQVRPLGPVWLAAWVAATVAGFSLSGIWSYWFLPSIGCEPFGQLSAWRHFWQMFVFFGLVGFFQWPLLGRVVSRSWLWPVATAAGWRVSATAMALGRGWGDFPWMPLGVLVGSVSLGTAQSLVLRLAFKRTWKWTLPECMGRVAGQARDGARWVRRPGTAHRAPTHVMERNPLWQPKDGKGSTRLGCAVAATPRSRPRLRLRLRSGRRPGPRRRRRPG